MFSENNKVSGRQLGRMIFVETSGTTAFLSLHIFGRYGSDGLLMMIWVYLFALIYAMGCFKLAASMGRYPDKRIFRWIKIFAKIILLAKYLCVAAIVLNALSDVVKLILVQNVSAFIILAVTVASLIYCVQGGIESRGRACEVLFYFVFVPIVIICAVLVPKLELRSIIPTFDVSLRDMVMDYLVLIWLLVPAEMLVLCRNSYDNTSKVRANVYVGITLTAVVNMVVYAVALGVYGAEAIKAMARPILKLMQISGIPGGFFNRQDGIMSVFLIVSLFVSGWALIYHINELIKSTFMQNRRNAACKVSVTAVVLVVALVFIYDGKHKESLISADVGGMELEERRFVMSVIVNMEDDKLVFNFEIAGSDGGGNEGGSVNVSSIYEEVFADSLDEAISELEYKSGVYIDFSHMKALVINKKVLNDSEVTRILIAEISANVGIGENIMICAMKGNVDEDLEYGKNIEKLTKSKSRFEGSEVYKFEKMYALGEGSVTVPLIDNEIRLVGSVVVNTDVVEWENVK